jgi:hypothetical protein
MTNLNHQQQAQLVAVERAATALASVDLSTRCAALGLSAPTDQGLVLRAFGQDVRLTRPDFAACGTDGKPVRLTDRLLALHYLTCDLPLVPTGRLITFRELPGGQFYFGPFSARTTRPLVERIGNDLERLRKNLGRFDWCPAAVAAPEGLAACLHALGRIEVTLVYHGGGRDDEEPPGAEVLFDSSIKRVFAAEDVAALASRICLGLL